MKKILVLFFIFSLIGCNSVPKPPEPSGAWSDINKTITN